METLRSHVHGAWHAATDGFVPLHDPSTEAEIARASSVGIDFGAALDHAREVGGRALRAMTFAERGEMLIGLSKAIHAHRDELLELSMRDSGVTRKDAKFDIDGATGTLSYYGYLGRELGDRKILFDGEGLALGRSAKFWGRHASVPRQGVAVHINAFNFPAWGFAEKAAQAWLAGMPVVTKPATSTAWVTARCGEIVVESGLAPEGAFSMIVGSTGDLLTRLGPQDVLAFTGSADTGNRLRSIPELIERSVPVNIEADSLNATVLAPSVEEGSETWGLFLRDVAREITQKSGQKCTAVRRIFVPRDRIAEVREALIEQLEGAVVGSPFAEGVTLGALATASQLDDAVEGCAAIAAV
ncbi:MAG: 3,4-dehydroadipyl-CoA semialdehyde dehydrogenase, partial [Planctomycetota bacterium]